MMSTGSVSKIDRCVFNKGKKEEESESIYPIVNSEF